MKSELSAISSVAIPTELKQGPVGSNTKRVSLTIGKLFNGRIKLLKGYPSIRNNS